MFSVTNAQLKISLLLSKLASLHLTHMLSFKNLPMIVAMALTVME